MEMNNGLKSPKKKKIKKGENPNLRAEKLNKYFQLLEKLWQ